MKAINFINWKYIGLTGCLVASLLTACGDDETGPEVVTPLEPKLEIVNEASTFSFSSSGKLNRKREVWMCLSIMRPITSRFPWLRHQTRNG